MILTDKCKKGGKMKKLLLLIPACLAFSIMGSFEANAGDFQMYNSKDVPKTIVNGCTRTDKKTGKKIQVKQCWGDLDGESKSVHNRNVLQKGDTMQPIKKKKN